MKTRFTTPKRLKELLPWPADVHFKPEELPIGGSPKLPQSLGLLSWSALQLARVFSWRPYALQPSPRRNRLHPVAITFEGAARRSLPELHFLLNRELACRPGPTYPFKPMQLFNLQLMMPGHDPEGAGFDDVHRIVLSAEQYRLLWDYLDYQLRLLTPLTIDAYPLHYGYPALWLRQGLAHIVDTLNRRTSLLSTSELCQY